MPKSNWFKHPLLQMLLLYALIFAIAIIMKPISQNYLDQVFGNALASYAATRGLNALVSIMQESSLSAGFFVEGNVAIGQILDPANDLLERFSSLLLLSLASIGIQKFLLAFGFPLSLCIAALSFIIGLFSKNANEQFAKLSQKLMQRGTLIAIFLVLLVPLIGFIGKLPLGLNQQYDTAQNLFQETKQSLEADYGLSDNDKKWYERLDLRQLTSELQGKTEIITKNVLDLIVVFAIQTLLLPLLTLIKKGQA